MDEVELRTRRDKTRFGRAFTIACWAAAAALLATSLCWPIAGWRWEFDLVANLSSQFLMLAFAGMALFLATRRLHPALVTLAACLSFTVSLCIGRGLILPRSTEPRAAGSLRLLHYNASAKGTGASIEAMMFASNADVLSIACPPAAFQVGQIYTPRIAALYPSRINREWKPDADGYATDITPGFVIARWPLREIDTSWLGNTSDSLLAAVVERPAAEGGEFAVLALHPRSPRTAQRWAIGNLVVDAAANVSRRLQDEGYAVVILADLNSSPGGWRSRELCSVGRLRRAKPLLSLTGTYPMPLGTHDDTHGPGARRPIAFGLGIAIDDAWVSPGIEITGWSFPGRMDSGHVPLFIDVRIPARAGATATSPRP